jgi:hypothetical protein
LQVLDLLAEGPEEPEVLQIGGLHHVVAGHRPIAGGEQLLLQLDRLGLEDGAFARGGRAHRARRRPEGGQVGNGVKRYWLMSR